MRPSDRRPSFIADRPEHAAARAYIFMFPEFRKRGSCHPQGRNLRRSQNLFARDLQENLVPFLEHLCVLIGR